MDKKLLILNSLCEFRTEIKNKIDIYRQISPKGKKTFEFLSTSSEKTMYDDIAKSIYDYMKGIIEEKESNLLSSCKPKLELLEQTINKEMIIPDELKYILRETNRDEFITGKTTIDKLFGAFRRRKSHSTKFDEKDRYQLYYEMINFDDLLNILLLCDSIINEVIEKLPESEKKIMIEENEEIKIRFRQLLPELNAFKKIVDDSDEISSELKEQFNDLLKLKIDKVIYVEKK